MPSHNHSITYSQFVAGGFWAAGGSYNLAAQNGTGYTGGGQPHNNLQPYNISKYIIKF